MHHHLLVRRHPETKVNTMARIRRASKLVMHSLKKVWHMEVVGLLCVLSVLEPTQVNVVMAKRLL